MGSPVTVGAGAVSRGFFAVLVGLLPVLLDVAPAEVGRPVGHAAEPPGSVPRPLGRVPRRPFAIILNDAEQLDAMQYTVAEALGRLRWDIEAPSAASAAAVVDRLREQLDNAT